MLAGRDNEIAPQCRAAIGNLLFLLRIHAPDDAADIARSRVDLVEHPPGIRDVEEAVLGERRRLDEFLGGAAGERNREGELQVFDIVLADAGKRREALAVIAAVVHQPVLRLAIRIGEPGRRDLGREGRRRREHAAEQAARCA